MMKNDLPIILNKGLINGGFLNKSNKLKLTMKFCFLILNRIRSLINPYI